MKVLWFLWDLFDNTMKYKHYPEALMANALQDSANLVLSFKNISWNSRNRIIEKNCAFIFLRTLWLWFSVCNPAIPGNKLFFFLLNTNRFKFICLLPVWPLLRTESIGLVMSRSSSCEPAGRILDYPAARENKGTNVKKEVFKSSKFELSVLTSFSKLIIQ